MRGMNEKTQSGMFPTLGPGDLAGQFIKKGQVERRSGLPGCALSELSFGHAEFQVTVEITQRQWEIDLHCTTNQPLISVCRGKSLAERLKESFIKWGWKTGQSATQKLNRRNTEKIVFDNTKSSDDSWQNHFNKLTGKDKSQLPFG